MFGLMKLKQYLGHFLCLGGFTSSCGCFLSCLRQYVGVFFPGIAKQVLCNASVGGVGGVAGGTAAFFLHLFARESFVGPVSFLHSLTYVANERRFYLRSGIVL